MVSIGWAVVVGALYWFGFYGVAFWIVVFLLVNGGLGLLKAYTNRDWYEAGARAAGVEPNFPMLVVSKLWVIPLLIWAGWHVGSAADYF